MASQSDSKSAINPASGVALILAALGVWYLLPSALKTLRPEAPAVGAADSFALQDIPARLWEDPFSAVERSREQEQSSGAEPRMSPHRMLEELTKDTARRLSQFGAQLGKGNQAGGAPALTIMPVMVSGGWQAEGIEERLRERYAVVSALAVRQYNPDDPEAIGLVRTCWRANGLDTVDTGECRGGVTVDLPFEWFARYTDTTPGSRTRRGRNTNWDTPTSVLVLWIDEARVWRDSTNAEDYLGHIGFLVRALLGAPSCGPKALPEMAKSPRSSIESGGGVESNARVTDLLDSGKVKVSVIGPATSTALREMYDLALTHPSRPSCLAEITKHLDIYSTRATIPLWSLGTADPSLSTLLDSDSHVARETSEQEVREVLGAGGFTSLISDDFEVAGVLVHELETRGIQPLPVGAVDGSVGDQIAFVGESDTSYGRLLPELVKLAFVEKKANPAAVLGDIENHVHDYRYFRGLDGLVEGKRRDDAKNGKANGSSRESPADRDPQVNLERPEGPSQLDAVRRIADKLKGLQADLAAKHELLAIGIVGNDPYDKLLILQALRPRLSGATFFSTDLDERLVQPSLFGWTRNVIIGSGFGLELTGNLQSFVPPFRECYQASTFLGCLLALGEPIRPQAIRTTMANPRLFVIGRGRAFDISPSGIPPGSLFPNRAPTEPGMGDVMRFGVALELSLLLIFVIGIGLSSRYPLARRSRRVLTRFGFVFLILAATLVRVVSLSNAGAGEPLTWLGGISIWPSEGIRLIAAAFSMVFLVLCAAQLRATDAELEQRFELLVRTAGIGSLEDAAQAALPRSVRDWWAIVTTWPKRLVDSWRIFFVGLPSAERGVAAEQHVPGLWRTYKSLARRVDRGIRVVSLMLMAIGLLVLISKLSQASPQPPTLGRDALARLIDGCVLLPSALLTWVLTLYVLDAAQLARSVVRWLWRTDPRWPDSVSNRVRETLGLDLESAREHLKIRFIAALTKPINRMVVYPSVSVFLLIVARSEYFDDWGWPIPLVAVFVTLLTCVIGSGLLIRQAAEAARRRSVANLRRAQVLALGNKPIAGSSSGQPDEITNTVRRLDLLIAEIEAIKEGAFAPWSQNRVVQAILLPFGGFGMTFVLDSLMKLAK